MAHIDTPHLNLPFALTGEHGTSVDVVDQDTPDDIANCVEAILRYTPGQRQMNPGFGVTDQTFRRDPDLDEIRDQISEHEPRAAAAVEDMSDELMQAQTIDEATRVVRVALES